MKKLIRYLNLLITNDTGYNSKTQVMIWGVIMVTVVMMLLLPLIWITALYQLVVPWYGIAAVFSSLATLQGVLVYGKIKTDSTFYENFNRQDNIIENEKQDPKEDE